MKVLADSEDPSSKLILIGINKAGQQLVKFAHDLGMRVDVFKLETNPEEKIQEMIALGEAALKVKLPDTGGIADTRKAVSRLLNCSAISFAFSITSLKQLSHDGR